MKLRPHHLLCTQSYAGKGYSPEFVENMDNITARLRNDPGTIVEIVASTDDICEKCPLMLGADLCKTNEKVKTFDTKVMAYFGVEAKKYIYRDVINEIDGKINAGLLDDICGECDWYAISTCRDVLLKRHTKGAIHENQHK